MIKIVKALGSMLSEAANWHMSDRTSMPATVSKVACGQSAPQVKSTAVLATALLVTGEHTSRVCSTFETTVVLDDGRHWSEAHCRPMSSTAPCTTVTRPSPWNDALTPDCITTMTASGLDWLRIILKVSATGATVAVDDEEMDAADNAASCAISNALTTRRSPVSLVPCSPVDNGNSCISGVWDDWVSCRASSSADVVVIVDDDDASITAVVDGDDVTVGKSSVTSHTGGTGAGCAEALVLIAVAFFRCCNNGFFAATSASRRARLTLLMGALACVAEATHARRAVDAVLLRADTSAEMLKPPFLRSITKSGFAKVPRV